MNVRSLRKNVKRGKQNGASGSNMQSPYVLACFMQFQLPKCENITRKIPEITIAKF